MAVDLAMDRARSRIGSSELCLKPKATYETLLHDLCETSQLGSELLDAALLQLNAVFYSVVPRRPVVPTLNIPRLIRERGSCPQRVPEGVVGLLNVGLVYHNQRQTELAVSTYLEALDSWMKAKCTPVAQRALMVICGAIGAVLESSFQDEEALAVYLCGVAAGEQLPERCAELGFCHGCVGSVLFHLGMFDAALGYFKASLAIRRELMEAGNDTVSVDEMAVVENNIGACSVALVDNVYGMEMYHAAYERLREKHDPNHAFVQCVKDNISRAKLNMGNHEVDMKLVPKPIFRPKKEKKAKGKGKKKKKKK